MKFARRQFLHLAGGAAIFFRAKCTRKRCRLAVSHGKNLNPILVRVHQPISVAISAAVKPCFPQLFY
jgi:hypothetical protein